MTTLTELFSNIAGAIRSKTGGTAQIVAENFPAEIAAISTGTDTSDATATAANIEAGKTAYVKGQKVTGNLMVLGDTYQGTATPKVTEGKVSLGGKLYQKMIIQSNSNIEFLAPYSAFGTATASDVAAGKTFTGADGLKVEGTAAGVGEAQYTTGYFTPTSKTAAVTISNIGFTGKNFICFANDLIGDSDRDSGGNYTIASLGCINGQYYASYFLGKSNATYFYGAIGFSNIITDNISCVFDSNSLTLRPISISGIGYLFQFAKKQYAYMIWA